MRPTAPQAREPILDVARGLAVLGILLVNVQLMRGPDIYAVLIGTATEPGSTADRTVGFLVGWLAGGKFLSSFAILFGIGAAIVIDRARRAGRSPRQLLARRYGWLLIVGLLHMLLLFPGDILFLYGLTGMVLLFFVDLKPRAAVAIAAALVGVYALLTAVAAAAGAATGTAGDDPMMGAVAEALTARADAALAARTGGGVGEVLAANAWEALLIQGSQLFALPWVLGLFLLGLAVVRAGWIADLPGHTPVLRRIAIVGVGLGLPLNLGVGLEGPLGIGGAVADAGTGIALFAAIGASLGAPLLACGYLALTALIGLRVGTSSVLASTGRMALTAYLLQSVVAMLVFTGLGRYGELTLSGSLWVVLGIWAVVLTCCPLWARRFRMGPVEWLWRWATYGVRPPLRHSTASDTMA